MKFHSHRALPTFFVIVLGVLLLAGEAQAAILTWNCTNDVWSNTACWNPNSIPTGSDTVYVPTVSSSNTLLTIDGTTGAAIAGTVYIDASVGTTVTLQQTASSLGGNLGVRGLFRQWRLHPEWRREWRKLPRSWLQQRQQRHLQLE